MYNLFLFISSYQTQCHIQNQYKNEFLEFLSNKSQLGHITVSGMVCTADFQNLLLCFHNRYKEWTPIGGHLGFNETVFEALNREINEEIGILDKNFYIDSNANILSLDKKKYQCRTSNIMHYDIALIVILNESVLSLKPNQEIKELRFFNIKEKEFLSVPLPFYTRRYCLALEAYLLDKKF